MDYQKDTSAKDTKDIFKIKDDLCHYVFLKIEKLTSALYIVTDFLSDREPLRWKLRELSLDLVFNADSLIKDKKDFFGIANLSRVSSQVGTLITLLDIAYVGGTVSQMNLEILKQEYQNLLEIINNHLRESSLKKFISDESISGYHSLTDNSAKHWLPGNESVGSQSSERINSLNEKVGSNRFPNVNTNRYIGQKDRKKDTANDLYGLNSQTAKKSLRKEQIVNFLKDKNWTGITDISKALPDCGAKTVQRELLDMVSSHILKKQGERRWSRYMLA